MPQRSQQDELKNCTAAVPQRKVSHNSLIKLMKIRSEWCLLHCERAESRSTLEIAGSETPMEVDTEATVTAIPISVYEQYLSHVQIHASTVTSKTYSGGSLKVKTEATVPVTYGEQHAPAMIIVVMYGVNQPFLGGIV